MKPILQAEATECGLACIAMALNGLGDDVDLASMRQRFEVSMKGSSLRDIMNIADEVGLSSRPVRLELDDLYKLSCPAILHWNLNHFVVLAGTKFGRAIIFDPARGERAMTMQEVSKHFTGVALELARTAEFKPIKMRAKTHLSSLWGRMRGGKRAFFQVAILSILLQFAALVLPLYSQLVIDEAVTRFDPGLLVMLALGFGFVVIISAITQALRDYAVLAIGQSLSFQITGNIFRHLLRLRSDYFEKRHIGDILSRINSVTPIRDALAHTVVTAVIDGVMAIGVIFIMFVYDWRLSMVAIVATLGYFVYSIAIFPVMRDRREAQIAKRAKEQSHIMESIRAARAIKVFSRESERESAWRNIYADVISATTAYGRINIINTLVSRLVFGIQMIFIVYLGARAILGNSMTIGMLFAFLAYRQNFADRTDALARNIIEFRMLGLHLDRLADIVQSPIEERGPTTLKGDIQGEIRIECASFRYASNDPFLFENVSLSIAPGEYVAIAGRSGGGKTTLLKIMLGLLEPEQGSVLIDGQTLQSFGLRNWRAAAGVVMQDDQLLTGSIADNISFFDPSIDMKRVRDAAHLAQIHDDIERMPMKYLSYIGDMGAALSGGQRQRLLLARALYHEPKVLFLDEGTANLDEATEHQIAEVIANMPVTRVVIAHRPALIAKASRVIEVNGSEITERATTGLVASGDQF